MGAIRTRPRTRAPAASSRPSWRLFHRLGVDGVFADNPDTAVAVRATHSGGGRRL